MAALDSLTASVSAGQQSAAGSIQVWDVVGTELSLAVRELGTELLLAALFCAGFMFFRMASVRQILTRTQQPSCAKAKRMSLAPAGDRCGMKAKELEANWAAGRGDLVLEEWPSLSCFTVGALRAVVEALAANGRAAEVPATLRLILVQHPSMRAAEALATALDALPAGQQGTSAAAEVRRIFASHQATHQERTVERSEEESAACSQLALAALERGQLDEALAALAKAYGAGRAVSSSCLAAVVAELGRKAGALRRLPSAARSPALTAALAEAAAKAGESSLLREVQEQLPPASLDALLRGYAAAGDGRAASEALDAMLRAGVKPSEATLTAAVSLCAEPRHVQLAERAVDCARQSHGRVTLALYSALIKVYTHARLWHKICDLYADMRRDGVKPDTVAFGCLIKAAVESGRHELARRLFQESGNPDLLNYMSLIRAAGRERDVPRALRLLEELEKSPLSADATAYNCALEACAACGDRASAEQLLRRMEAGGHVDVVSYNTYLKLLLAKGARADATAVLQEMQRRKLWPNAVTYNSLVKDAVLRQDMRLAWKIAGDMEQKGVRPDAFTCSILMKGVKQSARLEDVDRILELVHRAGVTPDEVLTNCLLDACVRLRDAQRLTRVLEQFKATGVTPSPNAYSMLIRAYGHARQPERAWELWHDLVAQGSGPSDEAFAAIVDASLACGDLPTAASVFRDLRSRLADFPRAPAVFAALVKACIQCKQARIALDLYAEVKDALVCGKVTYNTLIDALVRQGDLTKANELFRDMTLMNVTPDLITYSTLIKGHCTCGDLEQGLVMLRLMQRRGIAPDAVLFNSILDGCAHRQMRALTEQVLRDMEAAGIAPSNFTLSILVKLYGRCGDLDAAFHVVNTYPEKYGFKLNTQVCTCLMSACIANQSVEQALQLYDRMGEEGCSADGKTYQTLLSGCLRFGDLDGAMRLLKDALGHGCHQSATSCIRLDREVVEGVLMLAVRRGRSADVAAPLLQTARDAGVAISDRVAFAVRRQDGQEPRGFPSSRGAARAAA